MLLHINCMKSWQRFWPCGDILFLLLFFCILIWWRSLPNKPCASMSLISFISAFSFHRIGTEIKTVGGFNKFKPFFMFFYSDFFNCVSSYFTIFIFSFFKRMLLKCKIISAEYFYVLIKQFSHIFFVCVCNIYIKLSVAVISSIVLVMELKPTK